MRRRRGSGWNILITVFAALALPALGLAVPGAAAAESFTRSDYTLIPGVGTVGNAYPYPTEVDVHGLTGPTTSVSVTINGFSHTAAGEVGMVLCPPYSGCLLIQGRAGDYFSPDMTNVTYTLSDDGATYLPETDWGPGTYKPTAYTTADVYPLGVGGDIFYTNPGPVNGGTATFAGSFNGKPPNGYWRLFIRDFYDANPPATHSGSLSGGWTLNINGVSIPAAAPAPTATSTAPKCKKKRKKHRRKKCRRRR
jgi:hypothetical protein